MKILVPSSFLFVVLGCAPMPPDSLPNKAAEINFFQPYVGTSFGKKGYTAMYQGMKVEEVYKIVHQMFLNKGIKITHASLPDRAIIGEVSYDDGATGRIVHFPSVFNPDKIAFRLGVYFKEAGKGGADTILRLKSSSAKDLAGDVADSDFADFWEALRVAIMIVKADQANPQ